MPFRIKSKTKKLLATVFVAVTTVTAYLRLVREAVEEAAEVVGDVKEVVADVRDIVDVTTKTVSDAERLAGDRNLKEALRDGRDTFEDVESLGRKVIEAGEGVANTVAKVEEIRDKIL